MSEITISKAEGTWVVRAGGAVLAETRSALALKEPGYPEVIYFPRDDIAMAFLDRTEHATTCPHKGTASYFSIVTKSQTLQNTAWSYEDPHEDVAQIKGHLGFTPGDYLAIEQV